MHLITSSLTLSKVLGTSFGGGFNMTLHPYLAQGFGYIFCNKVVLGSHSFQDSFQPKELSNTLNLDNSFNVWKCPFVSMNWIYQSLWVHCLFLSIARLRYIYIHWLYVGAKWHHVCTIVGHRSTLCLPFDTNFMSLAKRWFCVCVVAKGLLYTTYTWRNLCQPISSAHPFFNMRLR
jgi:hypothetical protein